MEKLFPLKQNIFILNINVRRSLLKSTKSCSILGEKPNYIYITFPLSKHDIFGLAG